MKPLRLAIVTRRFWPQIGGAEKALAGLAIELAARGCPITVVTARWHPRWPAQIGYHEVPVVRLSPPPAGRWKTFRYVQSLARWLRGRRSDFDLIYVSMLGPEAYAALRGCPEMPVVLRAERSGPQGDCLWQIDALCGRRIKRECMRGAAFVAPTPPIERELQAAGYSRQRIHHIPNGVCGRPERTPTIRHGARVTLTESNAMLETADSTPLVVCAGRLEPSGGLEHLIAAWREIALRRPNARLWMAGQAPDRAGLHRQIEMLGLGEKAMLIGMFDEVEILLAAADVFAAPFVEGAPMAILEAMAAGLPVVAADVPANRWLVSDGQDGVLTPPGDAAALGRAISRLLEQPDLAARLGNAARERASHLSLAQMADAHLTLFDRLTG